MKKFIQYRTPLCSYLGQVSLVLGVIAAISSCSSDPQKRPSPLRLDSGIVNNVLVKVEYSSPGVKGREIFGEGSDFLVGYDQMWRTGANDASFMTLAEALAIDTTLFDSGRYSIFTIPSKNEWTVIFNREWKQWGSYAYQDSLDILRVQVPTYQLDSIQERMIFLIEEDSLKFRWEKTGWAIKLN